MFFSHPLFLVMNIEMKAFCRDFFQNVKAIQLSDPLNNLVRLTRMEFCVILTFLLDIDGVSSLSFDCLCSFSHHSTTRFVPGMSNARIDSPIPKEALRRTTSGLDVDGNATWGACGRHSLNNASKKTEPVEERGIRG